MNAVLLLTPRRYFVPATDDDRAKLATLPPGIAVRIKLGRARNYKHHRKFLALVSFVAEHHPRLRNVEAVLTELKMRTGHYDHFVRRSGEVVYIPRSIAFDEMDEGDFVPWSTRAREIIFAELLPEFTEADRRRLSAELEGWLSWA